MTEFDFYALRRSTRSNYRTAAAFNAIANAIRRGVEDDEKLIDIATKAEREFDDRNPHHD